MASPLLGQKLGISPFASDIPSACDTGDELFQGAGRAGISHSQQTPPPTLQSFDCGHYTGQLIKSIGAYYKWLIKASIFTLLIGRESDDLLKYMHK